MTKITRQQKFTKELGLLYRSQPNYEVVKDLYLDNDQMSIPTARRLLNIVKFDKFNNVKGSSLDSRYKFDNEFNKQNKVIKPKQSIDQMNESINKSLKRSQKEYKYVRHNYEQLLDKKQIDTLLKNLNPTHKYVLKIKSKKETKYFTINPDKKGFSRLLDNFKSNFSVSEISASSSDDWVEANFFEYENIEIIDITDQFIDDDTNTMNRNVGKFQYYNNHSGVDLSDYQIYSKSQRINNKNCLIYSLEKSGVDKKLINKLMIKYSTTLNSKTDICVKTFEYIKRENFNDVANIINQKIKVYIYNSNGKNKNKITFTEYGSDVNNDIDPIELAIYDNHIFNYKQTIYKRYSVKNYDKLIVSKVKSDFKWYEFGSKDNTKEGKLLSSLSVVKLLDDLNKYEKIPYKIDLNDNVEIFTTNDLLNNLDDDQKIFEYVEKDKQLMNIFFGDLENINYTDKLNVPFLSGIIHKDDIEPQIYHGDNCIEKMLDYVVSKSKIYNKKENTPQEINILYFHNMKYDFSLMKSKVIVTNIIEKDNQFYSVDLIYKNIKITLRDSYKVFNNKLEKFGTAFNLDKDIRKKEAIAYDYYNENTINESSAEISDYIKYIKKSDLETFNENVKPFMIPDSDIYFDHIAYYKHYLKYDCLVLQKGMIAYNKCMIDTFEKPIFDFLTISSYADDYFKSKGVYDDSYEVKSGLKKFLSKAVYGGRVNVCPAYKKQIINKRINDFDGVSLYPSAIFRLCKEFGIPIGKAKRYNKDIDLTTKDYYVVEIEINEINKKQQNPFIAYKTKESIQYINEIPETGLIVTVDRFTLEDYVKFHKIKYNIIDGVYWDEGFNKKFIVIKDVFDERLKQKALKTSEGDIKQELYKLILNSAYGKTLLKSSCEKDVIVKKENFNKYVYNNFNTIKHAKRLSDNQYIITQYSTDDSYNRAHCGIAILSMSKRIMNEVMGTANDNNINIYYQDTDSMHMDDDKIPELALKYNEIYEKELIGKEFGQFHSDFSHKNKKCVDVVAIKSIFLGKKAYIDYLEGTLPDGKKEYCIHARMKGINEISLYNKANEIQGGTISDKVFKIYEDLSEDKQLEFILNPDEKPSFIFTSQGVRKREPNKFKRNVSF